MKKILSLILLVCPLTALVILFPNAALAVTIKPAAQMALEFGGDTLVYAVYSDGSKSELPAGRGVLLGGGASFDFTDTIPLELLGTFGIKWTSIKPAKNGTANWTRWPLQVLAFYRNIDIPFRVGGGLVYQIGNKLSGSGDGSIVKTDFKDAAGLVLEADYIFGEQKNLAGGIRYTNIGYTPQNSTVSVNGDSFGVDFSITF